jgi:APA family basic amino acid/polyamine antiporter
MHSGIIAAISLVFAHYAQVFVPLDEAGASVTAIASILVLSAVNLLGVRHGSTLQALFTAGKLLAIGLVIVMGFALGGAPDAALRAGSAPGGAGANSFHDFALALAAGLFAYGGWHMVTYSAGETVNPRTTIPRALAIGTAIVTACYIALNAAYLYVLPLATVTRSQRIAADAANAVLGSGGERVMAALVTFSAFGSLAGIILAGPRVYYAMARDGVIFRWLGAVHPTRRTPDRAIVLQAVWSSVLVATDTYKDLYTRVIYTEWIFFGLLAIGLIRLRRHPNLQRGYSVWGYPFVPVLFAIAAFGIVVNQVLSAPRDSILGLSFVLVGLPVYYLWAGRKPERGDAQ